MSDVLDVMLADLDRTKLRVAPPSKVVFLCGGQMAPDRLAPPQNLRDYLLRTRNIREKVKASFVLAESAQTLYRDTTYPDLIEFEEDIARISAIVLVISESAGSLAELGAFAADNTIRKALRILISEQNHTQESFVRFGPVERIIKIDPAKLGSRVGVFPWRSHKNGQIIKRSVQPIYRDIKNFISQQVGDIADTFQYHSLETARVFYDILWLTFVAGVISPTTLYEAVRRIYPALSDDEIRNKIFCMKVAGWIDKIAYSNKEYYFCKIDADPFEYAYKPGVAARDSLRRKAEIRALFKAIDAPPPTVYKRAIDARSGVVV